MAKMHCSGLLLLIAVTSLTAAQDLSIPNINGIPLEDRPLRGDKVYAVAAFAKVNWFTAQQICAFRGLTLASINSAAEQEGLRNFLSHNGLIEKNFWLSGTNLANQDNWFWLSSGLPFTFTAWARGEPNNAGGVEHCLALLSNGLWNDANCNHEMYFICENRCALDSYSVPLKKRK